MLGLYVSNLDPTVATGYLAKISGQARGFVKSGYSIDVIRFDCQYNLVMDHYKTTQPETVVLLNTSGSTLTRRMTLLRLALCHISKSKPDFIYLRYPRADPIYLGFLFWIRQRFPRTKILSEFPTYPYDSEYQSSISAKDRLVFVLDKLSRGYLKYFVDCAVSINYDSSILGMNTISIDNGVEVENYELVTTGASVQSSIMIVGIANVSEWHGYDRLIKGIARYYEKKGSSARLVCFSIIGVKQPYLNTLIHLSTQEGIGQSVVFHSPKQGKELDLLLQGCNLAVGVLGAHRKGLSILSPLKNREYCARGLPFIYSHIDPDFPDSFEYALETESGDEPIDIEALIEFSERLLSRQGQVTDDMRRYARERLDWSVKLKPIVEYIDEAVRANHHR